jgi:glycosyltransferase involved in cell wall biosynthesis
MKINWMAYQYREYDGYGRFSNRFIAALARAGVAVHPTLTEMAMSPPSTRRMNGWHSNALTIQCAPVFYSSRVAGPSWLFSMTEGSELPDQWAEMIAMVMPERVIVPCEYNATAFRDGIKSIGLDIPVSIINGGTDPAEFDRRELNGRYESEYDYTFLALSDRGARKGWCEVWEAFYRAFGRPVDTPDVRLIIKSRPEGRNSADKNLMNMIANADNPDPRIEIWREDVDDMRDVWSRADCVAMPSRSEGFGMPHREAAMTGVPVITQQYGGVDDGHCAEWSFPVGGGKIERIPEAYEHIKGEWMKADVPALADMMKHVYTHPRMTARIAQQKAKWLAENQTWDHAAAALIRLMEENGHGVVNNTTG